MFRYAVPTRGIPQLRDVNTNLRKICSSPINHKRLFTNNTKQFPLKVNTIPHFNQGLFSQHRQQTPLFPKISHSSKLFQSTNRSFSVSKLCFSSTTGDTVVSTASSTTSPEMLSSPATVVADLSSSPVIDTTATAASTNISYSPEKAFFETIPPETIDRVVAVLREAIEVQAPLMETIISPTKWVELGMTFLHNVGLPWWLCIVTLGMLMRLLMLPMVVKNLRNAPMLVENAKRMREITSELQLAKMTSDLKKQEELSLKVTSLYKNNFKAARLAFISLPIFMVMYWGLTKLCVPEVALQLGLTEGGILWFKNLIVPDAYLRFPIITSLMTFLSVKYGSDVQVTQKWVVPLFAVLAVLGLFITRHFPMAVHLYWSTTAFMGIVTSVLLRRTRLREVFKIPPPVGTAPPSPVLFTRPPTLAPAKKKPTEVKT